MTHHHAVSSSVKDEMDSGARRRGKRKNTKISYQEKMNLHQPVPVLPFKTKTDRKSFMMLPTKITVVRDMISLQSAVQMSVLYCAHLFKEKV